MNMSMQNRLTRSFAAVHADVESNHRSIKFKDLIAKFEQQLVCIPTLRFSQSEVVLRVPARDYKNMSGGYGKLVGEG